MSADLFASVRGPIELRPFPIAPLLELTGLSLSRLALRVGASGSVVSRAKGAGLTDAQADRWAVACGFHPSEVWPDWFALAPNDTDVIPACTMSPTYTSDPGAAANCPGSGQQGSADVTNDNPTPVDAVESPTSDDLRFDIYSALVGVADAWFESLPMEPLRHRSDLEAAFTHIARLAAAEVFG